MEMLFIKLDVNGVCLLFFPCKLFHTSVVFSFLRVQIVVRCDVLAKTQAVTQWTNGFRQMKTISGSMWDPWR